MKERFGATNPKAMALRFHAQTGGSTLTAQQPENNIVRVAIQALVGGRRRRAVAAHELVRRGARAADRARGAHRAADAAGHRGGGWDDRHRRSARRLVLRRGAHGRARGARVGAHRARRRARRRRRGGRAGLRPGRDRAVRVRMAAAGRARRARHRRRQPLRGGRAGARRAPAHRPGDRAAAARAHRARPRGAERGGGRARARRRPRGRARRREPSPADARSAPGAHARSARSARRCARSGGCTTRFNGRSSRVSLPVELDQGG